MLFRNDVGPECNTARRLFWEKCTSRSPKTYSSNDASLWADGMLAEWDKRWIVEASDEEEEVTFDSSLDEVLP